MSAFENTQRGIFFTIYQGKFSIRTAPETPGAEKRVNKNGKTVYEIFHDSFNGKLIDIKLEDSEYGKQWLFIFENGGEQYNLQLSYSNSFATAFLKMLPNIDLSKTMKLTPSIREVDGKTQNSLFVTQDNTPVKHAYTRENPNGMPDLEKIIVRGEETWDNTKRMEFLKNMVDTQIIPVLTAQGSVATHVESIDENTGFGVFDDESQPQDITSSGPGPEGLTF